MSNVTNQNDNVTPNVSKPDHIADEHKMVEPMPEEVSLQTGGSGKFCCPDYNGTLPCRGCDCTVEKFVQNREALSYAQGRVEERAKIIGMLREIEHTLTAKRDGGWYFNIEAFVESLEEGTKTSHLDELLNSPGDTVTLGELGKELLRDKEEEGV